MSKKYINKYSNLLDAMDDGFCMILEVFNDKKGIKLSESQSDVPEGMMRVTGIAAKIGVKNRNGRIYNADNYKYHIQTLQSEISKGLYGELEHPEGFTINVNNISHKIEKVWFDEITNEIKITILLLDTEKGKIAQSIIKSGGVIRVSSRARGSVNNKSEAMIEELITFDIVGTPGFSETELYLSENMQKVASDMLSESYVVYNNKINNIGNKIINNYQMNRITTRNRTLLESAVSKQSNINDSVFTPAQKKWLIESFGNELQNWLIESYAKGIQNWILEEALPMHETYMKRKAINESKGKSAISFATFANSLMESEVVDEITQLTQEEQEALTKMQQGEKLQNGEIVLAESAFRKLREQQEQQEEQEQEEQEDNKQQQQKAAQMSQKRSMRQSQQEDNKQQEEDDVKYELVESLKRKATRINSQLKSKYHSLLESKSPEEEKKLNQEISDLQDTLEETQEKIENLTVEVEGENGNPENGEIVLESQEKKFQQAMQIVADGQELKQEDIEGLSQSQIQEILEKCKTNESQFPGDDLDKKVLGESEDEDDEGDEDEDEDKKQLPPASKEEEIKESLLEKRVNSMVGKSGSLLEGIQKRMEELGKKK